jgi:hypothetical protein
MATNDTSALITFDQLIQGMMLKGEHPDSEYNRMIQIAIDGYRELNLVVLPEGRNIEKFTMDSNYIVYMPDDLILVNRICVPIDGELWPLTKRDSIVPTTSESGGSEVLDEDDGEGVDVTNKGIYYSRKGGRNYEGYFRPDYRKRRIIFRNVSRTEVLMDYVTSGVDLTETTYIPIYAKTALEAYIRLYQEYNKMQPNPNNIAIYKDLYDTQKSICRGIKFSMTDFLDTIYKTYSPTSYL